MWKEFTADGVLRYANFLETVSQLMPMYAIRAVGGTLYLIGGLVGGYNLYKTAKSGILVRNEEAYAAPLAKAAPSHAEGWHRILERMPMRFSVWVVVAVVIGGVIEFVPTWLVKENIPTITSVKPYTPLELQGRDIYIREGCVNCHSQMIRPFRSETERYGEYSKAGEYVYDHPFLWGSKRTGPDLMRVGGKYPDSWHYNHMIDPTSMSPGSIMPAYPWLAENDLNASNTADKIKAMRTLGVPYEAGFEDVAEADLQKQAEKIATNLTKEGYPVDANKEIIAMIAYLQRLGTDIKLSNTASK